MRTLLLIYFAFISSQIMAQRGKSKIDIIKTDKNRYSVDEYSSYFDLRDINDLYKRKGIRIEPRFYSYYIKNLSNKIDVSALQKKYRPKGYEGDDFNPYYRLSHESTFLLDSLFRKNIAEDSLKESYFYNTDTTDRFIRFNVIYDLAGKVAEVTLINFTTSQPAKFDIKDVEKMEEIIKTYADFVPNKASDNRKIAMGIYPKINYFWGVFDYYYKPNKPYERLIGDFPSKSPYAIEVPKFNIQPKAN
jgi:hypothetical protein